MSPSKTSTGSGSAAAADLRRRGAGTLSEEDLGERVLLAAWVHRRRDLGGLLFLDLRDRSGLVQAVVQPEVRSEAHAALDPVRSEWVVEVEGTVAERSPENVNPALSTGRIEVRVDRARVLASSETPPVEIDGRRDPSEEVRLRHRFLDLRRPEVQRVFELRHRVSHETRAYLHEAGFLELETPVLTRSTPEGARDFLVPSRANPGAFYALPQSPQIFKQLLMVSGFERYYQIARCFRDEDLRADRQPEFTQIDIEMSFVDEEAVIRLVEGLFARIFPLAGIAAEPPFPRLAYEEAMARFGNDRPDLRFGLEIVDLSERLGQSGFRGFRAAIEEGGVVRGFVIPGAAEASRKQLEGWAEEARRYGAAGVLSLRRRQGEVAFQVKGALSDAELAGAADDLQLEEGGLALLAAGPEKTIAKSLGALRLEVARSGDLIDPGRHAFCWVTGFPLVEWDEEAERWSALHHPFTSPDPRDLELLDSDPGRVRSRAYDVVLDGIEVGGGSIRIHRRDLQERMFRVLGIGAEEAAARFGFLLDAFRYGAPPHGGIALGYDRLIMLMAGRPSIRDTILFPKTASGTCLMTGAPGEIDAAQLDELGLRTLGVADGED